MLKYLVCAIVVGAKNGVSSKYTNQQGSDSCISYFMIFNISIK